MKKIACLAASALLTACSGGGPKKADIPSLNPELASELLHFDHKADDWLTYVHKTNPGCIYKVDLPDQSSHPTEIDIDHLVSCGSRPAPKEFDASVVFTYDPAAGKWTVSRFSS